jgi:hypothetical protein
LVRTCPSLSVQSRSSSSLMYLRSRRYLKVRDVVSSWPVRFSTTGNSHCRRRNQTASRRISSTRVTSKTSPSAIGRAISSCSYSESAINPWVTLNLKLYYSRNCRINSQIRKRSLLLIIKRRIRMRTWWFRGPPSLSFPNSPSPS